MNSSLFQYSVPALLLAMLASPPSASAQVPTQCLEIESILVDACNPGSICLASAEGQNEMVRFITGPDPIALSDLEADWPNGDWLGLVQNGTTASLTAQLNATVESCGLLIEPPAGIIPPGSTVLLVTSTEMCVAANSFAALTDTIYLIFQAAGNTAGHFANSPAAGQPISPTPPAGNDTRTLVLTVNSTGCSDAVTYVRELLVNNQGTYGGVGGESDGGTVQFSWPGPPVLTYVNFGCQAPFDPVFVEAEADGVLCGGVGTVQLSGEVIGTAFTSVAWSGGTGTFGDASALNTTYTAGPGDTGNVVLQLCAQTDCAEPICGTVIIPAGSGPTPTITANGPLTICPGDALVLNASGADSYVWGSGETTPSITIFNTGTYTVTGTNACGTGSASVTVTQATGVVITITGNTVLCPGGTTVLTASGASSYFWSNFEFTPSITVSEPGTYSVTGSSNCGSATEAVNVTLGSPSTVTITGNTTICDGETTVLTANGASTYLWSNQATTPSITVSAAGTYSVVGSGGCGPSSASATVTVEPAPDVTITGNTQLCPGETTVLTASGATSFVWSTSETTPSITVGDAGTYSVTGTNNCGTSTGSATVVEASSPTVTITGNTTICEGATTVLTASGASSYLWSNQATTPSITVSAAGTYSVEGSSSCGSANATVTVVVNPVPDVTIAGDLAICAGQSTTLTATGADSFVWNTSETTASITVDASGTYSVTGTNSCGTSSASVTVAEEQLPAVQVSASGVLCTGSVVVLTASTASPVSWNTGETTATISVDTPGSYTATATNACGASLATITVVEVNVVAQFQPVPASGPAPLNVVFNNASVPANATFSWDFDGPGSSTATSPVQLFTQPGIYNVELTATFDGCSVSATEVVTVIDTTTVPPSAISLPNVFTPNGDRQNDLLVMSAENIVSVEVLIFNRWGQKVSELRRVGESWDARSMSGELVPDGTYFYTLVALGTDGVEHSLTGHVTVLR